MLDRATNINKIFNSNLEIRILCFFKCTHNYIKFPSSHLNTSIFDLSNLIVFDIYTIYSINYLIKELFRNHRNVDEREKEDIRFVQLNKRSTRN